MNQKCSDIKTQRRSHPKFRVVASAALLTPNTGLQQNNNMKSFPQTNDKINLISTKETNNSSDAKDLFENKKQSDPSARVAQLFHLFVSLFMINTSQTTKVCSQ